MLQDALRHQYEGPDDLTTTPEEQARQHHPSQIALHVAQGEPASTGYVWVSAQRPSVRLVKTVPTGEKSNPSTCAYRHPSSIQVRWEAGCSTPQANTSPTVCSPTTVGTGAAICSSVNWCRRSTVSCRAARKSAEISSIVSSRCAST